MKQSPSRLPTTHPTSSQDSQSAPTAREILNPLQLAAQNSPASQMASEFQAMADQFTAQNSPPLQRRAMAPQAPAMENTGSGEVIQRYEMENLGGVNTLLLSPNQLRLYNLVKGIEQTLSYVEGLSQTAEDMREENPNLAREIRRRKITVRDQVAKIKAYIAEAIAPSTFEMFHRNDIAGVEAQAQKHFAILSEMASEIQEDISGTTQISLRFAEFMGDDSDMDEYHTGDSSGDAIPIIWYKEESDYPDIKLTTPDKNGQKNFSFPNGPTLEDGLGHDFKMRGGDAHLPRIGRIFRNRHPVNSRDTQQKIRSLLIKYGYEHRGKDGDHIQDLGWEGRDIAANVWPLDEKINRRPFTGWRGLYGINYKTQKGEGKTGTLASMQGKYFKVKGSLDAKEGSVPDEGKKPDPKSGTSA